MIHGTIDSVIKTLPVRNKTCEICSETVQIQEKLLSAPSEIALFHLQYPTSVDYSEKVLQLPSKISIQTKQFRLRGIIVHSGFRLDSGHYYCHLREEDTWITVNDSLITREEKVELEFALDFRRPTAVMYEVVKLGIESTEIALLTQQFSATKVSNNKKIHKKVEKSNCFFGTIGGWRARK